MKRPVLVAAAIAVAGAAGVLGWRNHARAVALRDAPACAMAKPLGETCERCIAAFCCAEISACYGRTDCIDLNDCTIECGESKNRDACRARCATMRPQAVASFVAWDGCARSHCESECPRGEDD